MADVGSAKKSCFRNGQKEHQNPRKIEISDLELDTVIELVQLRLDRRKKAEGR